MREILFRGKTEKGEWVYGSLIKRKIGCFIVDENNQCALRKIAENLFDFESNLVHCKTVGQYTGLTDKNGKKIFEGDIVKNDWCFARGYSVIEFGQYKSLDMSNEYQQGHLGFYLEHLHEVVKRIVRKDILYFANKCEVIGNIHDNPELLESEVDTE